MTPKSRIRKALIYCPSFSSWYYSRWSSWATHTKRLLCCRLHSIIIFIKFFLETLLIYFCCCNLLYMKRARSLFRTQRVRIVVRARHRALGILLALVAVLHFHIALGSEVDQNNHHHGCQDYAGRHEYLPNFLSCRHRCRVGFRYSQASKKSRSAIDFSLKNRDGRMTLEIRTSSRCMKAVATITPAPKYLAKR